MRLKRARAGELLELFDRSGRNVERTAVLLRELIGDFPEQAGLAADIEQCESDGDRLAHDIIYALNESGRRPPMDPNDGYALATALDDVVDYAEQTADALGLYRIEAPMEQAVLLADVLVASGAQVAEALRRLRNDEDVAGALVEIHRLENEGDRLLRDGVAALFVNGIDPMVVIRWKDIFESLEQAIDACEKVAHVLEGIGLRGGVRR